MRDRPAVGRVSASAVSAPTAPASRWRDIGAGLCVAGLLLPEAVAYAGLPHGAGADPRRLLLYAATHVQS